MKKFKGKTIPAMTINERVHDLERKYKNLQEYLIDLIEKTPEVKKVE